MRLAACFAFAGTILTFGARAHAQTSDLEDRARSWYDQAAREFAAGSFAVAARDFLAADSYGPSPTALEMALRSAESSRDDATIATVIARARGRLLPPEVSDHVREATKKVLSSLAEIEVVCDPKPRDGRCLYRVDDGGWATVPALVRPGEHNVFARVEGGSFKRTITVAAGEHREISTAEPVSTSQESKAGPTGPTVGSAPAREERSTSPTWFWVAGAVTVAVGGFTGWSAYDTMTLHDAWEVKFDPALREDAIAAQTRTNIAAGITLGLVLTTVVLAVVTKPFSGSTATVPRGAAASGSR